MTALFNEATTRLIAVRSLTRRDVFAAAESCNHNFHNTAWPLLNGSSMNQLTCLAEELEADPDELVAGPATARPACYSVTIFTNRWKEVRDFYVDLLEARVLTERDDRYCDMNLAGVPLTIRRCEHGEMVSYFHLYIALKNRTGVLGELRRRGIIVTNVGPYTNFRDPEGRVIKLSDARTTLS